ncbi:hypothetical protein HDA39_004546 [Kribbella italica]|uniref:Uncharacterized protein n=1 Tax=Kribbella italica TaxID=1540520 RepID=A0A7W9MW17_9ACTN|nr:hypothetical protein [Kribbella italica]
MGPLLGLVATLFAYPALFATTSSPPNAVNAT